MRRRWSKLLKKLALKHAPESTTGHAWILTSFDHSKGLQRCSLCQNLLWGTTSQGYMCHKSGLRVHTGCMSKAKPLKGPRRVLPEVDQHTREASHTHEFGIDPSFVLAEEIDYSGYAGHRENQTGYIETGSQTEYASPQFLQASDIRSVETARDAVQLIDDELGSGEFGIVHKGILNGTKLVAVKVCKPGHMTTQQFVHEAAVLLKVRHPKVVQCLAVCPEEGNGSSPMLLVTELASLGNFRKYLKENGRDLDSSLLIEMCVQVTMGLEHVAKENVIHGGVCRARHVKACLT